MADEALAFPRLNALKTASRTPNQRSGVSTNSALASRALQEIELNEASAKISVEQVPTKSLVSTPGSPVDQHKDILDTLPVIDNTSSGPSPSSSSEFTGPNPSSPSSEESVEVIIAPAAQLSFDRSTSSSASEPQTVDDQNSKHSGDSSPPILYEEFPSASDAILNEVKAEVKDALASLTAVESPEPVPNTDPSLAESPPHLQHDQTLSASAPISDPDRLRYEPHSDERPNWANAPEDDDAKPSRKNTRAALSQTRRPRKTTVGDARDRDETPKAPTLANVLNPRLIVPRPGPQGGIKSSGRPARLSPAPRAAPSSAKLPSLPRPRTVEKHAAEIADLGNASSPPADVLDRHDQAKQTTHQRGHGHQSLSENPKPTSILAPSHSVKSPHSSAPVNQIDSEHAILHGDLNLPTDPRLVSPQKAGGSHEGAARRKLHDFMAQGGPRQSTQPRHADPRQTGVYGNRSVPATASNSIPISPSRNRYTIAAARAPTPIPLLSPKPPGQSVMNSATYSDRQPRDRRHLVLQQREDGEMHLFSQDLREQQDQRRLEWEYARSLAHLQHPQELGVEGRRELLNPEGGTNPSWTFIAEQLANMSLQAPRSIRSRPPSDPTEGDNWNISPGQPWQPHEYQSQAHAYASQDQLPMLNHSSFPQPSSFAPRSSSESFPRPVPMRRSNAPHAHDHGVDARSSPQWQGDPDRGPQIRPARDRAQTRVPSRTGVPDYGDASVYKSTRSSGFDTASDNRYREENWRSFDG